MPWCLPHPSIPSLTSWLIWFKQCCSPGGLWTCPAPPALGSLCALLPLLEDNPGLLSSLLFAWVALSHPPHFSLNVTSSRGFPCMTTQLSQCLVTLTCHPWSSSLPLFYTILTRYWLKAKESTYNFTYLTSKVIFHRLASGFIYFKPYFFSHSLHNSGIRHHKTCLYFSRTFGPVTSSQDSR